MNSDGGGGSRFPFGKASRPRRIAKFSAYGSVCVCFRRWKLEGGGESEIKMGKLKFWGRNKKS